MVTNGDENEVYTWKDPGICAVANFKDIVEKEEGLARTSPATTESRQS